MQIPEGCCTLFFALLSPLSIFILKIYGVAKWIKKAMLLYLIKLQHLKNIA